MIFRPAFSIVSGSTVPVSRPFAAIVSIVASPVSTEGAEETEALPPLPQPAKSSTAAIPAARTFHSFHFRFIFIILSFGLTRHERLSGSLSGIILRYPFHP